MQKLWGLATSNHSPDDTLCLERIRPMTTNIKRVIRFGRHYRFEHLEGKRFIVLALFNAAMMAWCLLEVPAPWKLLAILSLAGIILSIVRLIKDNIVTMPDWAKDVWDDEC